MTRALMVCEVYMASNIQIHGLDVQLNIEAGFAWLFFAARLDYELL